MGKLLVYIAFLKKKFFNILDSVSHSYTLLCDCRGGSKNEKCPIAIADLVLLYNAAQEGLHCPVKYDRSAFYLFALCLGTKKMVLSNFVKLTSNAFALTCMIFAWFELMLPKKDLRAMKLVMQFLDHHRLCHVYFTAPHSFLNLWFWNIPFPQSFNVWPSLVDGDEQRIATRVPAMLWRGRRLPDEYQH